VILTLHVDDSSVKHVNRLFFRAQTQCVFFFSMNTKYFSL